MYTQPHKQRCMNIIRLKFSCSSCVCLNRSVFRANDYLDKNYIFPLSETVFSHFAILARHSGKYPAKPKKGGNSCCFPIKLNVAFVRFSARWAYNRPEISYTRHVRLPLVCVGEMENIGLEMHWGHPKNLKVYEPQ